MTEPRATMRTERGTFRFGTVSFTLIRRADLQPLIAAWALPDASGSSTPAAKGTPASRSLPSGAALPPSRTMTLTGAHGVAECRVRDDVQRAHDDADYVLCDGTPPWLGGMVCGHRHDVDRIPGRDAMREIAAAAAAAGVHQSFIGGPPGLAEFTKAGLESAIGTRIDGTTWSPPFVEHVDDAYADVVADQVRRVPAPAIVWIGLSTPKQELLAQHLKQRLPRGYFFAAVGAAFDMYAGTQPPPPPIVSRAGLEWLYRSIQEPRRLTPRYARALPAVLAGLAGAARDRITRTSASAPRHTAVGENRDA